MKLSSKVVDELLFKVQVAIDTPELQTDYSVTVEQLVAIRAVLRLPSMWDTSTFEHQPTEILDFLVGEIDNACEVLKSQRDEVLAGTAEPGPLGTELTARRIRQLYGDMKQVQSMIQVMATRKPVNA